MIVCPACHAENPDGTKICVKCGTELPKVAAAAGPAKARPGVDVTRKFSFGDMGRDTVDLLWLLLILALVLLGFWMEATHWAPFAKTEEEAKLIQIPLMAVVPKHSYHPHHATHPVAARPHQPVGEKPVLEYGNPESFYEKGKIQYDNQHYHSSFNYLKQALMIDPTFAKAYFGLGYLYARYGMDDVAVRMYEMALRFDPNHADSVHNLGVMYYDAGNYDDALPLVQKAVALNDQNADYEFYLGTDYLEKGQPGDALEPLQKAASLRSDDAQIYYNLARTYENLGKKSEAIDALQKVIQLSKDPELIQSAQSHIDALNAQS